MNSTLFRPLILCACLGAIGSSFAADTDSLTPAPSDRTLPSTTIPDRYIVQVAAGVDPRSVAATHGVSPNFVYQTAVRGFAGTVAPGRVAALRADPRVLSVVPDRKVAAIGKPTGGSGGGGEVTPEGVKRIGATAAATDGAGVGVAVVDTGVDLSHTDLQPLGGISFSAFGSSAQDNNGHGTHVAGTIAARKNGADVVGVAPGATIYAVKVLDASGSGSDSEVIAGLDWVAAHFDVIRVANMSLGREASPNPADDEPMHTAIKSLYAKGIAVVVAAGNDATLEVSGQVPSGFPEVIAVASATAKAGTNQYRFFNGVIGADTASYFTSDGKLQASGVGVTVTAPGEDAEDINKAGFLQSVGILSTKLGGGTTRMSGTSMASPHVAGVAALLYQNYSSSSVEDIRRRISRGADRQGVAPLDSPTTNYSFDQEREGILNAPGALAQPATVPTAP